jgi:hypothetical protein
MLMLAGPIERSLNAASGGPAGSCGVTVVMNNGRRRSISGSADRTIRVTSFMPSSSE